MDPNAFIVIAIIVFVFVVILVPKKSKGQKGEYEVSKTLGKNIDGRQYIINNIIIVNEGKSSQIDHILIKKTGIFVIETKNYSGQIYGGENQREWTQVLQYGKVKNQFYNPIMQNKTHIYALSKVLVLKDCYFSIIVFPQAQLMTDVMPWVGNIGTMNNIINGQYREIFTSEEIFLIYQKLLDFKTNPRVSEKDHITSIRHMKRNINNNLCPRCGKPLVKRSSAYGTFYGCSAYPSCTFKMKE